MRTRLPSLLSLLSLLSLVSAACHREVAPQDLTAGATTRKTQIFLIASEAKPALGCGADAVPVEVELPAPAPALRGSLEALLAAGKSYESAGYYNALASSPLRLQRIERSGDRARIYLAGYLELGGECDGPRVLSQLTATATQFRDLRKAELFLDGRPLRDLLAGKG